MYISMLNNFQSFTGFSIQVEVIQGKGVIGTTNYSSIYLHRLKNFLFQITVTQLKFNS